MGTLCIAQSQMTVPAAPVHNPARASRTSTSRAAAQKPKPDAGPATPTNTPSLTGVPRYHAGFRGPRGTAAPVDTAIISITGKGDHTGTGGGTGINSSTLDVPQFHNALGIPSGTIIQLRLRRSVDSAHAKNGDMLDGVLTSALGSVPAGAPVKLTVVAAAAAGRMSSAGEISLQVVSVNGETILSNVVTAQGQEGQKIMSDDAPTRGTEAAFGTDEPILLPAA